MKEWKAAFAMGNAASDGWSTRARHWVGLGRFVVSGSILGIFLLPSEFDVSQDLLDRFLFFIFYFFLSPSYVYEFQDVVNFRDCALFDFAKRGRRVFTWEGNNKRRVEMAYHDRDLFNIDREFL